MLAFNLPWLFRARVFTGHVELNDPDTLMRLAIARDMQENGWQQSVTFLREDPPLGMHPNWSSLYCWLILSGARVFWFAFPDEAIGLAGALIGPFFAILIIAAAYWSARPLMQPQLAAAYSLAVIFSAVLSGYSHAGIANHHTVQVLVAVILFGVGIRCDAGRAPSWLLASAGVLGGIGLWISFEMLPIIELFCLYLSILWILQGRSRSGELLAFGTTFCAMGLAALLIDPPYGGYASIELDHMSLPYAFAISLQLGCVLMMRLVCPVIPFRRFAWIAVLCISAFVIESFVYPMAFAGPQSQVNPFVKQEWMFNVEELRPVTTFSGVIIYIGNGLIGLVALAWLPVRPRWKQWFCLAGLTVLCMLAQHYVRASIYASTTGSLAAFATLQRIYTKPDSSRPFLQTILAPYIAVALIFGCLTLGEHLHNALNKFKGYEPAHCDYATVLPALRDPAFLGTTGDEPVFVTELDKSPALLFYTNYRTLAGNYHTDALGLNDSFLLMRDMGWTTAHSIVADHDISYFLLCPTSDRDRYGTEGVELYWKYSTPQHEFRQPTFFTRIMDGTLPPWLVQKQWPEGVRTDLKLFEVVKPSQP